MQGMNERIERLRLMFGVEMLLEPRTRSHRGGRKIEKVGYGVVNCRGSATRIYAPIRNAAPLKQTLGRGIRLNERQDGPPNLEIFEQFSWDLSGGMWLQ